VIQGEVACGARLAELERQEAEHIRQKAARLDAERRAAVAAHREREAARIAAEEAAAKKAAEEAEAKAKADAARAQAYKEATEQAAAKKAAEEAEAERQEAERRRQEAARLEAERRAAKKAAEEAEAKAKADAARAKAYMDGCYDKKSVPPEGYVFDPSDLEFSVDRTSEPALAYTTESARFADLTCDAPLANKFSNLAWCEDNSCDSTCMLTMPEKCDNAEHFGVCAGTVERICDSMHTSYTGCKQEATKAQSKAAAYDAIDVSSVPCGGDIQQQTKRSTRTRRPTTTGRRRSTPSRRRARSGAPSSSTTPVPSRT
jgi:chemotaxis protein histidine kinase CheA